MQDFLWIVYDVAALVFIIAMLSYGWKEGLVKTLIRFLGGLIAFVAAVILSVPISEMVYERFIESKIINYVDEQLVDSPAVSGSAMELIKRLPENKVIEYIDSTLSELDLPFAQSENENDMSRKLYDSISNGNTASEAITDIIISPSAKRIIRMITGLILLALFSVLIKIIAGLLGEVVGMIPIIGSANRLLGAAAGGLWALAILYIIGMIFNLILAIFGSSAIINADALNKTYILSRLMF